MEELGHDEFIENDPTIVPPRWMPIIARATATAAAAPTPTIIQG
jgi:hypothetical protein